MKLAAFLRGINVGGKHQIRMADLVGLVESAGMTNVKTVLASGNLIFDSTLRPDAAASKLEKAIEQEYGFPVPVIVRSSAELTALVHTDPFRAIKKNDHSKLYVSFLPKKQKSQTTQFDPPKYVTVVFADQQFLCMVLNISNGSGTPELMSLLDKHYGKSVTTRSWETLIKCIAA